MAKMFYTTDEAAQKLGISGDQLKSLVSESKLREFRDGAKVMFKVDQVDKLASDRKAGTSAGSRAGSSATGIGLADSGIGLADSHAPDTISLADSTASPTAKDDTVVTGAGQQVFKPGEVKAADTGAQTHIEPAVDDQLALDGVGSGSGLLDLTRESDDTSLGAELLDEIYPGGDSKGESGIGSASGIFVEKPAGGSVAGDSSGPSGLENISAAAPSSPPVVVADVGEPQDATSGAFGGVAFASVLVSLITVIIAISFFYGAIPNWVRMITDGGMMYALLFGVALLVVTIIFGLVGMVVGKAR
jgi:excisionase family DNA binding protein